VGITTGFAELGNAGRFKEGRGAGGAVIASSEESGGFNLTVVLEICWKLPELSEGGLSEKTIKLLTKQNSNR